MGFPRSVSRLPIAIGRPGDGFCEGGSDLDRHDCCGSKAPLPSIDGCRSISAMRRSRLDRAALHYVAKGQFQTHALGTDPSYSIILSAFASRFSGTLVEGMPRRSELAQRQAPFRLQGKTV